MYNKAHKKKYLRFTDSVDDDNNSDETENGKGNIDIIINKLEKKLNIGNIHSGNADVILKMTSQNQETTRTTKNNDSIINNISNLLPNNIQEKDNEISQEIGSSIISVNSIQKGIKMTQNPNVDIDISLNNELKDELQLQENNAGNKFNIILSTNNSNPNRNKNYNNKNNNLLSRNKLLSINENSNNNLSTLSAYMDNSRYFLNKKNKGLISCKKIEKEDNEKKDNNKNNNEKGENKDKKVGNFQKINSFKINKKKYKDISFWSDCFDNRKRKRKCRNCNIITIIRDILITIIVVSAIAFYAMIFFVG